MVLDHGDAALHAGLLGGLEPLPRIGLGGGRKEGLGFAAPTPLAVGIGVHAVVEEGVKLGLVPLHLALGGQRKDGPRLILGIGGLLRHEGKFALGLEQSGTGRKSKQEESCGVVFFHGEQGM